MTVQYKWRDDVKKLANDIESIKMDVTWVDHSRIKGYCWTWLAVGQSGQLLEHTAGANGHFRRPSPIGTTQSTKHIGGGGLIDYLTSPRTRIRWSRPIEEPDENNRKNGTKVNILELSSPKVFRPSF